MTRHFHFLVAAATLVLMMFFVPPITVSAANAVHRLVIHVDDADPQRMNLALNNTANVNNYYQDKGEEVQIEIVTYGPGLHMLIAESSPVADRVKSFSQNFDIISFQACANTHENMSRKAGKPIELLPQARMVPSGVIHLMERQEAGWTYLRP